MKEQRKQAEIEHYDKKAEKWFRSFREKSEGNNKTSSLPLLSSHRFLREYLKDKCSDKKILDYGCGDGVNSFWLAEYGGEIIGVDLSKKSLEIAKERAKKEKFGDRVNFYVQDCENLNFLENSFDIIFDGGSFSSLNIMEVLPELIRVLKPQGFVIGIETFGHNPFTNLKRQINKITGKGTKWSAMHIFSLRDLSLAQKFFGNIDVYYFNLISWIVIPFLRFNFAKYLLNFLELLDKIILKVPFLRKYCFKVVFVFSKPKR